MLNHLNYHCCYLYFIITYCHFANISSIAFIYITSPAIFSHHCTRIKSPCLVDYNVTGYRAETSDLTLEISPFNFPASVCSYKKDHTMHPIIHNSGMIVRCTDIYQSALELALDHYTHN